MESGFCVEMSLENVPIAISSGEDTWGLEKEQLPAAGWVMSHLGMQLSRKSWEVEEFCL